MTKPLASVCIITYNQEKYIRQCIEGALNQVCDFPFEIVINDDCSKDLTSTICRRYAENYPDRIRYYVNETNLGMVGNWVAGIQRCCGRYVALCEGDDFFTDANKLQKQVSFLEQHADYSICFSRASLVYDDGIEHFYRDINQTTPASTTLHDLVKGNYIHTPTCTFRKNFEVFPKWYDKVPTADWALHMLNAQYGKIYFMPEEMAAYRIHYGGVLSTKKAGGPADIKKMEMYGDLARYFKGKDEGIAAWFKQLHYHQKAFYYGIENTAGKPVMERVGLLLKTAWILKKPKLFVAAALTPFLGSNMGNVWRYLSGRKQKLALHD